MFIRHEEGPCACGLLFMKNCVFALGVLLFEFNLRSKIVLLAQVRISYLLCPSCPEVRVSLQSFAISRHVCISKHCPRITLDNLVTLHLSEKRLLGTFDIPLRFKAVETSNKM